MTRRFAVAIIAMALVSACGPGRSTTQSPEANVTGVLINELVTAFPSGEPCEPAGPIAFVVFSRSGQPSVRTPLEPKGEFSLHLEPGLYSIQVAPPSAGQLTPATVEVPPHDKVTLT